MQTIHPHQIPHCLPRDNVVTFPSLKFATFVLRTIAFISGCFIIIFFGAALINFIDEQAQELSIKNLIISIITAFVSWTLAAFIEAYRIAVISLQRIAYRVKEISYNMRHKGWGEDQL